MRNAIFATICSVLLLNSLAVAQNSAPARDPWTSPAMTTQFREQLSEEERVAGLSKVWAEVKFNFVNFEFVPQLDWDAEYMSYLPKVRQAKSTLEYYRLLAELVGKLHDGHTNLYFPTDLNTVAHARPLIRTRLIEDRVFVAAVWDEQLRHNGVQPGMEIVAVDGIPVRQYAAERVQPYQSASTPQELAVRTYEMFLLSGRREQPVELMLRSADGLEMKRMAPRYTFEERKKYVTLEPFEFRVLPGNIGYVALNGFETEAAAERFAAEFDRISQTDALIIDFRMNRGGYSKVGWDILAMMADKPFHGTRWRGRVYNPRDNRIWKKPEVRVGPEQDPIPPHANHHYLKPVILLTGGNTFSAAEDVAATFDQMHRGTIIGEPTGGSTGESMSVPLPGGGRLQICVVRDSYYDGRDFVGKGVQPNKVVHQTVTDFRAGRDTVLEAAVAELHAKLAHK